MAASAAEQPSGTGGALPTIFGLCGAAIGAIGFGAGFGASSYRRSTAFKELIEKFPEPPTAEAEQLARSGATKALVGGTALAGLMGVGAVVAARAYGIRSAEDFADEIRKWLPTKEGLEGSVAPRLEPLQRTITEHMQAARVSTGRTFQKSELGRKLSERAEQSLKASKTPLEPWEKEILDKLEAAAPEKK